MGLLDSKQKIYDAMVQTAGLGDKKLLYALAGDIMSELHLVKETLKKKCQTELSPKDIDLANKLANDPEFAKGWVIQQLAKGAESGNTAATVKELRDLLGIGSAESELQIEVVNYGNMCDCGGKCEV